MTLQGNKRRCCSAGTIRGGGVVIINNNNINTIDRQIDSLPFSRVCLCAVFKFLLILKKELQMAAGRSVHYFRATGGRRLEDMM